MVLANFNSIIKNLYKIAKHMQCIYIYMCIYIHGNVYICVYISMLMYIYVQNIRVLNGLSLSFYNLLFAAKRLPSDHSVNCLPVLLQ